MTEFLILYLYTTSCSFDDCYLFLKCFFLLGHCLCMGSMTLEDYLNDDVVSLSLNCNR